MHTIFTPHVPLLQQMHIRHKMTFLQSRNIFKKIYDEVKEDMFDMCNVRFLKENDANKGVKHAADCSKAVCWGVK